MADIPHTIPEMRHVVLDHTIIIENFMDSIIQKDLGFEEEYENEELMIGILNIDRVNLFKDEILPKFSLPFKFRYIQRIVPLDKSNLLPSEYGAKYHRFIEIRNIFAHDLAPRPKDRESASNYTPSVVEEIMEATQEEKRQEWESLYSEHQILNYTFQKFLLSVFYDVDII